jgi:hypothetical protein
MSRTATATAACHCPRCTIEREAVTGPFTPQQFQALGLGQRVVTPTNTDSVAADPGVLAAELEVRQAREYCQPFEDRWLEAVAAHRREEMATDQAVTDGQGGLWALGARRRLRRTEELARQHQEAREELEASWSRLVKAQERLRDATLAARMRAVETERG